MRKSNVKWIYKSGSWNDDYKTKNNAMIGRKISQVFKKYEDLNAVKQIIYSYAEKLINKLFTDERGEEILVNIEDAELYNRSLEDNSANYDPNTWENWLLSDINIVNSHIFFSYLNDSATEHSERLEETDIDFLKDVIRYINKELDRIED